MKGHWELGQNIEDASSEEPPEDEGEYSFEIITDEEIASLTCAFSSSMISSTSSASMSSSASSASMSSKGSSSSLGSIGTGPTTSVITARNKSKTKFATTLLSEEELRGAEIWYRIQLKGHFQDIDQELETMEDSSIKRSNWLLSLRHLREKLMQNSIDKQRFNINSIPEETREQLKHIYVY